MNQVRESSPWQGAPELAINGGAKARARAWSGNFTTGEEEKRAVAEAMDTGYLSKFEGSFTPDPPFSFYGGPYVQQIEKLWAEYYGAKHAVSMNSATSGLYAALGALRVGYGDEVIVPPSTMSACAVGPLLYGALPIFADVERETGCLDPKSIAAHITKRTKAILVVHQFGIPADMDPILELGRKHGIKIIEDCAQAHGAKYKGRSIGTMGDIGVFSLNVNKTIQCGEGAICLTNSADLHQRLALIRNHGEAVAGPAGLDDILNLLGFNYRMTEVHAAIGIEQLKKLESLNCIRLELVDYLREKLARLDFLETIKGRADCFSTYYQFPVLYRESVTGVPIADFKQVLQAEGIFFFSPVKPLYLQPIYQRKQLFKHGYPFAAPVNAEIETNYHLGACPVAERNWGHELLLCEDIRHPNTRADMDEIVAAFEKVGKAMARGKARP